MRHAVNVQIGLVLEQWSPLHHTFIWASIIVWFLYIVIYGFFPIDFATDLYHLFTGVVALDAFYWLYTLIAGPIACLLPFVAFRTIKRYFWPAMYQVSIPARRAVTGVLCVWYSGRLCTRSASRPAAVYGQGCGLHRLRTGAASRKPAYVLLETCLAAVWKLLGVWW